MTTLHIKNMVCPRCLRAVERLLQEKGYTDIRVQPGLATICESPGEEEMEALRTAFRKEGFELFDDPAVQLVEDLRRAVMAWARSEGARPKLSDYLSSRLRRDYSALSKLFSEKQGMTLERYGILHRIEYVKELLSYGTENINEIAYRTGYSSAAHLSAQFKRETGLSPRQFKEQRDAARRRLLDSL